MKKTVLFINAGHGGMDEYGNNLTDPIAGKQTKHTNGKVYHHGEWFYEGVFNRQIADEFISKAMCMGYHCVKVYDEKEDTNRRERINYGNLLSAQFNQKGNHCVWLSFHANAAYAGTSPQTVAEGVCTFVYKLGTGTAKNAELISLAMQKVFDRWGSKRRAQLIHDRSLDETTYTAMPAMLFEVGFFDNPHNADLLINPEFRAEVIDAMLKEIEQIYE